MIAQVDSARLAAVCRKYAVERLWLFGSAARGDMHDESDVDLLVETAQPIGLFALGGLQAELSGLFGRQAHLSTFRAIPEPVRPSVLKEAKLQYAA